jgi:hypothetical protein
MSLIENYAAERHARLVRLGAVPAPVQAPVKAAPKKRFQSIDPAPFYPQMWMWGLVASGGGEPSLQRVSLAAITDTVCRYFTVQKCELLSIRMTAELVYPRQICYYLTRKLTTASSMGVGRFFGRDHATVLHGDKKIRRLIREDWLVAYDIAHLEAML